MTSNSIYFKPTYLYIKQHSITGKLYFGKTDSKNPETYLGSGKHWKAHIKLHGKEHVETLWYCLFLDKESLVEFATIFSAQNGISESTEWLNMKPENGLDGGAPGTKFTQEHRDKIRASLTGRKRSPLTDEQKLKLSVALTGKKLGKYPSERVENMKAARWASK